MNSPVTRPTAVTSLLWQKPEHQQWREKIRSAFTSHLMRVLKTGEKIDCHQVLRSLSDAGVLGLRFNKAQFGLEAGLEVQGIFAEELGRVPSGSLGMALTIHLDMVAPVIAQHGSEKQWETFLKPAMSGDVLFSHAVTEPNAGSDVSNIETIAEKEGNQWRLNGKKVMISLADEADFHFMLVRLPERKAPFNMCIFMVPANAVGVSVSQPKPTMGNIHIGVADITLKDVLLTDDHRIGQVGMGFIIQLRQFVEERIISALRANQAGKTAFDLMVEGLRQRKVNDSALINQSSIQFQLADLEAQLELSRSATYHAFLAWLNSQPIDTYSATSKLLSSRVVRDIAKQSLHLGGWQAYLDDSEASRFYRDSRLFSISTGSDEMMLKSLIASEKLDRTSAGGTRRV